MSTDPSPPTDPWHQTIQAKTILAGTVASETVASETVASETRFGLRRRWLVGGGAITAVAAVTAFLVTLLWPAAAATPLEFRALEPVATVTVSEDLRVERARIEGDRVYLAALRQGTDRPVVIAADLRDGSVIWRQMLTDTVAIDGFTSTPEVILVSTRPAQEPQGRTLVGLDPDTGESWRHDYHDHDAWHRIAGVLTHADVEARLMRGLDARSGGQLWQLPFPADNSWLVAVRTDADFAGRSTMDGPHDLPRQDPRVVVVGDDRSAVVVDTRTGDILTQANNVAHPSDVLYAHDGWFYVANAAEGRLYRYELANLAASPQILYHSPTADWSPVTLIACGSDRICLLAGSDDAAEVSSLDADSGDVRWRHHVAGASTLIPVGDTLLVSREGPAVVAYDRDGAEVLDRPGVAARLDPASALLFPTELPGSGSDLSVAGLGFGVDGAVERTELGQAPGVRAAGCTWDPPYLACPTDSGAGIWTFADPTDSR